MPGGRYVLSLDSISGIFFLLRHVESFLLYLFDKLERDTVKPTEGHESAVIGINVRKAHPHPSGDQKGPPSLP
jgi:hypothetical protein